MSQRLHADQALLMVVDVQEKLLPATFCGPKLVQACQKLIQGCGLLQVPMVVTEQYAKGLGKTLPALQQYWPLETPVFDKTDFGAMDDPAIASHVQSQNKSQVILCGLEAHICIQQTAMGLLEKNYTVYLVEDAVAARSEKNVQVAVKKLLQMGVLCCTVEMVLFELMGHARHPQFKAVQQLVL